MRIVNAVTQIKTARGSFYKPGLPQNCHSQGRIGSRLLCFLLEAILRKHPQVTALSCLAPGEQQEPHGLGHRLHGGPVHCCLYWLAATITKRRIRSKVSHEKQPGLTNPREKLYYNKVRVDCAGICQVRSVLPSSQSCRSSPAEPHMGCKLTWCCQEAPSAGQDPSQPA